MARIAELLGCPLKTAFSRLYAARREIRAELQRAGYAVRAVDAARVRPWRGHAAPSLRAALEAFGVPTGAGAGAAWLRPAAGRFSRMGLGLCRWRRSPWLPSWWRGRSMIR